MDIENTFNDIISDPTKVYARDDRFTEAEKVAKLIEFVAAKDREMHDMYNHAKILRSLFLEAGTNAAKARELLLTNHGITIENKYPILETDVGGE